MAYRLIVKDPDMTAFFVMVAPRKGGRIDRFPDMTVFDGMTKACRASGESIPGHPDIHGYLQANPAHCFCTFSDLQCPSDTVYAGYRPMRGAVLPVTQDTLYRFRVSMCKIRGPAAGAELHRLGPDKPPPLQPQAYYMVLSRCLEQAASFTFGKLDFENAGINDTDPGTGMDGYEELVRWSLRLPVGETILVKVTFHSPTAIMRPAPTQACLLPTPGRFFTDLMNRWNAFAPKPFEITGLCEDQFDLCWKESGFENSGSLPRRYADTTLQGTVGTFSYESVAGADRRTIQAALMLARFAKYAGVGMYTARGMGQVSTRIMFPRSN